MNNFRKVDFVCINFCLCGGVIDCSYGVCICLGRGFVWVVVDGCCICKYCNFYKLMFYFWCCGKLFGGGSYFFYL